MAKGPADYYAKGTYNAICSICGVKMKANEMVRNWQGLWRCPDCNEPRQPQDFVRGIQDVITPPWSQPPEDIDIQICTYNGISAIPGVGLPGCMIPGRAVWDPSFFPPLGGPTLVIGFGQQSLEVDDGPLLLPNSEPQGPSE